MNRARQRLVVVSNRLPLVAGQDSMGRAVLEPATGGLVTALTPVLRSRGSVWIGWPGGELPSGDLDEMLANASKTAGFRLAPVQLSPEERAGFYHGFSNEVLWPLFHDRQSICRFRPEYWRSYLAVNQRFAAATAREAGAGDFVWVHDYHLMPIGGMLRALGVGATTGFFLHIPFPSPDIFINLPWRRELLRSLLDYDVVGFQTGRDRRNFIDCLRRLLPDAHARVGERTVGAVEMQDRTVRVGSFPISIDFADFQRRAAAPPVRDIAAGLRALVPGRQLILGIDRLDYTKGIPQRLEAFALALDRFPDLHNKVTLMQVVVPSREAIPQYHDLRARIERLVGEINGRFTQPGGWVPIHYLFRGLTGVELLGYYRAAHICLVTPLKDGMNLVAKEFCACSPDDDGVLILSEFAGSAPELAAGALLINPHDVEGTAAAIRRAVLMVPAERRARMQRMRRHLRYHDVYRWVDNFMAARLAARTRNTADLRRGDERRAVAGPDEVR